MRRRTAFTLGISTTAALTLVAGITGTSLATAAESPAAPRAEALYVPPANPDALVHIAELKAAGAQEDAAAITAMVESPQAVWFTGGEGTDVAADIQEVLADAASQQATPVLALYNVPGRDCANYSDGGASNTAEYQAWIDQAAGAIGDRDAIVILEPDGLALLPSDCGQDDDQGTLTKARFTEMNYAVDTLAALPGTRVYLDGGHSAWHGVDALATRLLDSGVNQATGFYLNTSNYQTDDSSAWYGTLVSGCVSYVKGGGDPANCPSTEDPVEEAQGWLDANVTEDPAERAHFVIDTSRNGQGPWTAPEDVYLDPEEWCNPPNRGLGQRPSTETGNPLHDANLWIKIPGESDGQCLRGTEGPEDPERGMVDPRAGGWFPEMALELVHNAVPPLQP